MRHKKDCAAALLLLKRMERAGQLLRACGDGLRCDREQERALLAQRNAVSALLSCLPAPQMTLLSLRYGEGLTPKMIQEKLGYSRSGYYYAVAHAIERVQTELEGIVG